MNNVLDKWHPLERMWLLVAPMIVLLSTLFVGDTIGNTMTAVMGTIYVILSAKGRWESFIFGIIHCLLYGIVSWQHELFSESILKIWFLIPLYCFGMYQWYHYTSPRTNEVVHQNLKMWNNFLVVAIIGILTYTLGHILGKLGDHQPWLDSFTTVGTIYGSVLMVRRCAEMWWIFFLVNVASVWMWFNEYSQCGGEFSFVMMWIMWTINSVWGWIKWYKT